jgi:hypothetical protein
LKIFSHFFFCKICFAQNKIFSHLLVLFLKRKLPKVTPPLPPDTPQVTLTHFIWAGNMDSLVQAKQKLITECYKHHLHQKNSKGGGEGGNLQKYFVHHVRI